MQATSQRLTDKAVALTTVSVPTTVAHGADISSWRSGAAAPRVTLLQLGADATATLSGGLVWGWDAAASRWDVVARVNDGADVTLGTARGFAMRLLDFAASYTRIAVSGTLSAGALVGKASPIEVIE